MVCRDCEKTYQVIRRPLKALEWLPSIAYLGGLVLASVAILVFAAGWMPVGIMGTLLLIGMAAIIGAGEYIDSLRMIPPTIRRLVRNNVVGWTIFVHHVDGMPHEHLVASEGYTGIVLQLRVGGFFRRCVIRWGQALLRPYRIVGCWNGVEHMTIRAKDMSDLTSSAPGQIIANLVAAQPDVVRIPAAAPEAESAKTERMHKKQTITPVAESSGLDARGYMQSNGIGDMGKPSFATSGSASTVA